LINIQSYTQPLRLLQR